MSDTLVTRVAGWLNKNTPTPDGRREIMRGKVS